MFIAGDKVENPLISVIIPAYNRKAYLLKCLKSIHSQFSYKNYEIIVVDDFSSENFRDIASSCDVYIRNDINLGPAYSRNAGALASKGGILLFLDSDVELLPDTFIKLNRIFEKDTSIGAVGGEGPVDETNNDVKFIWLIRYNSWHQKTAQCCFLKNAGKDARVFDVDIAASAFLAISRKVFFLTGGFDPYIFYMCEDRDICLNIKEHGYRVIISTDIRAKHFYSKDSNNYRALDRNKWLKFNLGKGLEVAIKRKGLFGGLIWMLGNYRSSFKPTYLFSLIGQFKKHKELTARKNINYLDATQSLKYYDFKLMGQLTKKLSFPVQFPLRSPTGITLFVTSKCNAFCDHCFIKGVPRPDREIAAADIIKLFSSLNSPVTPLLTGGEPFLRNDLEEIISGLMKLQQVRAVHMASNGTFPEKMEPLIETICSSFKKVFYFQISLDGPEKVHNSIRKVQDGFKKTIEAVSSLQFLQKKFANLQFIVSISIMKSNLAAIEDFIGYLEKKKYS